MQRGEYADSATFRSERRHRSCRCAEELRPSLRYGDEEPSDLVSCTEIGDTRDVLQIYGSGPEARKLLRAGALDISTPQRARPSTGYYQDSVTTTTRSHTTTFSTGLEHVRQHFWSLCFDWNLGLFRHRQDMHLDWTYESQKTSGNCIVHRAGEAMPLANQCVRQRHYTD